MKALACILTGFITTPVCALNFYNARFYQETFKAGMWLILAAICAAIACYGLVLNHRSHTRQ